MTTSIYAQIVRDTLPNGIIIENNFPPKDSIKFQYRKNNDEKLISVEETSFSKYADYQNWVIKGKIIPLLVPIPPGSGYNPSIGVEYGFCKNNSIGLDLTYYNYSFSQGDRYDSTKQEYVAKARVQEINTALVLSYRRYLHLQKIREKNGTILYFGSFIRAGKLMYEPEKGYIDKTHIVRENHYSIGLMFGVLQELYYFEKIKKPLYIDAYFGVFVKQKELKHEYYDQNNTLVKNSDYPTNVGIRIGLNFSMAFKRKSTRH